MYPALADELPVLVPKASRHLAAEAIRLRRDLSWFQQQRSLLAAGERRFPRRAQTQERIRVALERTSDCFVEILAAMVSHLDPAAVVEVAAQPLTDSGAYGARRICSLLRRDFGGEPEGEEEVKTLARAVQAELRATHRAGDAVLVIGCGAGRVAEELAATGRAVTAIDLSAVLLSAARLLRARPLDLCDVQTRNARDAASQAEAFVASYRPPLTSAGVDAARVRYAVADATAMPFQDESWPVIVSVFFTDVVPLSKLLPEIWRVLTPRGRFIHVGPLGYHFDDPAEHLAADELLDAFRFGGFEVGPTRWLPTTYYRTPGALCVSTFDNLVFSARKTRRRLLVEPPLPPFGRR
ncbi:MAG TPA: class I SAM-dependent methyltransferase [Polyangia bacterium]|nr:class I SAM-dependent methyltransferase [Polyangia bacterium]